MRNQVRDMARGGIVVSEIDVGIGFQPPMILPNRGEKGKDAIRPPRKICSIYVLVPSFPFR